MEVARVVVGSSGKRYRINRYLGEGVTSQVYEAVEESTGSVVAIKVLRREVGQIISDNFWQEGQILGDLARAERLAGDGLSNVPRVLDGQREGEVRFLVLELVTGTPLDRLLEEESVLQEQEALQVAEKVLRVLDLLHQQGRRTYTDFQLQNIWLQRTEDGAIQGIKVMDWNHVSNKVPDNQSLPKDFGTADLARFGAYFYRMLTGKGANEKGEKARALEKRAGEQWQKVSLGSRQLVLRALHPNPTRRFTSAAEFRQAIKQQDGLWQKGWTDQLAIVKDALRVPNLTPAWAEGIEANLDMAQRLGAPTGHTSHYRRQLQQHTGGFTLTWEVGQHYYQAEQYREAVEKWRTDAEASGRIGRWRWVMLAEAGVALGRATFASLREPLEEVVEALNDNRWTWAKEMLQQIMTQPVDCAALNALWADVGLHIAVAEAEAHELSEEVADWERASQLYRQALTHLQGHPYALLIIEEYGWQDLASRAQTCEQRASERRQTEKVEAEIGSLLQRDFEQGRANLQLQLGRDPTHQGLVRLCLNESQRLLHAKQARQAAALLEIGVLFAQVQKYESELREKWRAARTAVRQQRRVPPTPPQALSPTDDLMTELETLLNEGHYHQFLERMPQVPGTLLTKQAHWDRQIHQLDVRFRAATRSRLLPVAQPLLQVLAALDSDSEANAQRRAQYDKMVENLHRDQAKWDSYIRRHITEQWAKTKPAHFGNLITLIKRLLPLTEPEYPELKSWLEQTERELQQTPSQSPALPWSHRLLNRLMQPFRAVKAKR